MRGGNLCLRRRQLVTAVAFVAVVQGEDGLIVLRADFLAVALGLELVGTGRGQLTWGGVAAYGGIGRDAGQERKDRESDDVGIGFGHFDERTNMQLVLL